MQRRTQLAIIILIGLLLLALGLYLVLTPILSQLTPAAQPPALPSQVTPSVTKPILSAPIPSTTTTQPAATPTQNIQRALENSARAAVERIGSGSSFDGFLGYQDAMSGMTAAGQTALLAQQQAMKAAHPATGLSYGISTRAASSNLSQGSVGDASLVVTVEAIQTTDSGTAVQGTMKGKKIDVTFAKQADGSYLIDSLAWSDLAL
jgi:hypothetical protein